MGHQSPPLCCVMTVSLDPVGEDIARTFEILHPQADSDLVVDRDMATKINLDSGDDTGDVEAAAETLPPELGSGGLEIGHDGGVVDMVLGVDVAPPNLDRRDKGQLVHNGEGSRRGDAAVASTMMIDGTLRLWWASLTDFDGLFEGLTAELPGQERERAARFRIETARHRFVLARTVLRHELGAAIGAEPHTLGFVASDHGKPCLAFPEIDNPPTFNLSHSGDLVLLAIARVDVGVDVENLRSIPKAEKLAHRFFSPAERKSVFELGGEARDHAFLRIWTQKEAYLKATGLGVGMELRRVETEPDPGAHPRVLSISGDPEEASRWTLLEVEVPGAVCTVAVRGSKPALEIRRFTPANLGRR